jgi:Domain of unknown function (DUF4177)
MTNWEYKTVVIDQKSSFWGSGSDFQDKNFIEDGLNKLGQEGWELVSSTPNADMQGRTTKILLIFKRVKNNL